MSQTRHDSHGIVMTRRSMTRRSTGTSHVPVGEGVAALHGIMQPAKIARSSSAAAVHTYTEGSINTDGTQETLRLRGPYRRHHVAWTVRGASRGLRGFAGANVCHGSPTRVPSRLYLSQPVADESRGCPEIVSMPGLRVGGLCPLWCTYSLPLSK